MNQSTHPLITSHFKPASKKSEISNEPGDVVRGGERSEGSSVDSVDAVVTRPRPIGWNRLTNYSTNVPCLTSTLKVLLKIIQLKINDVLSKQSYWCLGNLSLYNEQLLLSTPLLKALCSLSRCPLSTKSSWRTGYASWRIQTLMEGSYTYFLQVHQVSTIQVQVLGLELSHRSCHQLFHRPLVYAWGLDVAKLAKFWS